MNRTKFYNTAVVNNVKEVDHLYNTLSSFKIKHSPSYYRTNSHDVGQPDLISKKLYDTERYWWVICLVNDINNPFTDIEEGTILQIPSILDIYDFYQKYNVR